MVNAQELEARVTINHTQIETTRTEVFDALQTKLTDFLNNHKWTEIPFRENEKIQCNFNITVNTYKQDENTLECTLLMNSSRPVYGSTYNTVAYAVNDKDFTFEFNEFDQLEYQENQVDNNLVALLAYYAYMIHDGANGRHGLFPCCTRHCHCRREHGLPRVEDIWRQRQSLWLAE